MTIRVSNHKDNNHLIVIDNLGIPKSKVNSPIHAFISKVKYLWRTAMWFTPELTKLEKQDLAKYQHASGNFVHFMVSEPNSHSLRYRTHLRCLSRYGSFIEAAYCFHQSDDALLYSLIGIDRIDSDSRLFKYVLDFLKENCCQIPFSITYDYYNQIVVPRSAHKK